MGRKKKYNFIVGVPCSRFKNVIDYDKALVATKEDEAVALAVGVYLTGKKPLVFIQNSGLGNCVDIITSLLKPYGIKIDLLISVRTKPEHHTFMGKITQKLLELMEYKNFKLIIQE